jgi:hypothetical protein
MTLKIEGGYLAVWVYVVVGDKPILIYKQLLQIIARTTIRLSPRRIGRKDNDVMQGVYKSHFP